MKSLNTRELSQLKKIIKKIGWYQLIEEVIEWCRDQYFISDDDDEKDSWSTVINSLEDAIKDL